MHKLTFEPDAWEDFENLRTADPSYSAKVSELINSRLRTPFEGIGKPEALKNKYHAFWSRRITLKD